MLGMSLCMCGLGANGILHILDHGHKLVMVLWLALHLGLSLHHVHLALLEVGELLGRVVILLDTQGSTVGLLGKSSKMALRISFWEPHVV